MDFQTEKFLNLQNNDRVLTIKPCIYRAFVDIYIFIRVYMITLASKLSGVPVISEDLETSFCSVTNLSIK